QRMWETNSYKAHEDHMMLYEALEKSMNHDHTDELLKDPVEARKKKKKRRDSPKMPPGSPPHQPPPLSPPAGPSKTLRSPGASGSSQVPPPPPPPPSTNQEGQSQGSAAPSSSKTAAEYKAWTTTDTRLRPSILLTPEDLQIDDDMALDAQVHSSDDEDIRNDHIPKVNCGKTGENHLRKTDLLHQNLPGLFCHLTYLHGARLYTLENLDIPQQVSKTMDEIVTNAVDWAIQALLRNCFRDLPEADMKEILHQRMWETNSYKIHKDHMMLYEALEKSMNRDHSEELLKDLAEARKKKKKRRFTAAAYPKVPENLKLTVEEHVILEEPANSTGTLSSLQHIMKDLSFGDLFFNNKPSEADNEKTTVETKAESMVSVTIQQHTSAIPPMTTPIVDLTSRPDSPNVRQPLQATATKTITTTTTIHPPPPQPQQSTTDSILMKHIGELEHIMANLIQYNKHLEERLDSHGARLYTLENLDIPQ
nr:hypothetical protein [Tanacetum cinerariifolium]